MLIPVAFRIGGQIGTSVVESILETGIMATFRVQMVPA